MTAEEALDEYILSHIDGEGELLARLSRDTHIHSLRPRMMSGHLQGRILKMICRMQCPRRILEIGTFTGYSTLCLAEGMPADAELHTVEIDDEIEDFTRQHLALSPFADRIHLHMGDAFDVVPRLGSCVYRCRQAALFRLLRYGIRPGCPRWYDTCRQYIVGSQGLRRTFSRYADSCRYGIQR